MPRNAPTKARPDEPRARPRPNSLLSRLHRFGVHNGGATAIIGAILFPVVVGGLGLGAETGYWYLTQRKLQHIADVSAHAAGARLRADDTDAKVVAAAKRVAAASGYRGTPELVVNPNYGGDPLAMKVEVIATDTQPRLFSAVVGNFFSDNPETTVTMSARAVAQVVPDNASVACVLALAPNLGGAVTVSGSSTIVLKGCNVASNSNAVNSISLSSALSAKCAFSVGGAYTPTAPTLGCGAVKTNAPLVRDPYAHVAEPAVSAIPCEISNKVGSPNTVTLVTPVHSHPSGVKAIRFCAGLDAKGSVKFGPGLYIIENGAFKMTSSDTSSILSGTGVTFYFTNGGYLLLGGTSLDLVAPTSDPFKDILFFGSRTGPAVSHQVGGNSNSTMTGAIYTPTAPVTIAGNAESVGGDCTQVIAYTVTFTGRSTLESACPEDTKKIYTAEMVNIIE